MMRREGVYLAGVSFFVVALGLVVAPASASNSTVATAIFLPAGRNDEGGFRRRSNRFGP